MLEKGAESRKLRAIGAFIWKRGGASRVCSPGSVGTRVPVTLEACAVGLFRGSATSGYRKTQHIAERARVPFRNLFAHAKHALGDETILAHDLEERGEWPRCFRKFVAVPHERFVLAAGKTHPDAHAGSNGTERVRNGIFESPIEMRERPQHVHGHNGTLGGESEARSRVERPPFAALRLTDTRRRFKERWWLRCQRPLTPTRSHTKMRVSPPLITPGIPRGP